MAEMLDSLQTGLLAEHLAPLRSRLSAFATSRGLSVEAIQRRVRLVASLPRALQHAYALLAVMAGWVFFRCDSIGQALAYLRMLWVPGAGGQRSVLEFVTLPDLVAMAAGVVLSAPVVPWLRSRLDARSGARRAVGEAAWMACLLALFLASVASLLSGSYNPFIYFRF